MRLLIDPRIWGRGLWLPASVFLVHYLCGAFVPVYARFPDVDRVFHFAGGFAIAFATAGVLAELIARNAVEIRPGWLVFPVALASTALFAVLWEGYEFVLNRGFGIRVQTELDDTLFDLFLGVAGGAVYCVLGGWRMRRGSA